MMTITERAAKQIRGQLPSGNDNGKGSALRIAVKQDEDGTFEYGMGFDEISDDDVHLTLEGVDVIVSPSMVDLLDGTTLDYVEIEPGKHHFIFMNPNDPNFVPPKS